jgi:hypothetical protein
MKSILLIKKVRVVRRSAVLPFCLPCIWTVRSYCQYHPAARAPSLSTQDPAVLAPSPRTNRPPHLQRLLHGLPVETLALITVGGSDCARRGGGTPTLDTPHRAPTRLSGRNRPSLVRSSPRRRGSLGLRLRAVGSPLLQVLLRGATRWPSSSWVRGGTAFEAFSASSSVIAAALTAEVLTLAQPSPPPACVPKMFTLDEFAEMRPPSRRTSATGAAAIMRVCPRLR